MPRATLPGDITQVVNEFTRRVEALERRLAPAPSGGKPPPTTATFPISLSESPYDYKIQTAEDDDPDLLVNLYVSNGSGAISTWDWSLDDSNESYVTLSVQGGSTYVNLRFDGDDYSDEQHETNFDWSAVYNSDFQPPNIDLYCSASRLSGGWGLSVANDNGTAVIFLSTPDVFITATDYPNTNTPNGAVILDVGSLYFTGESHTASAVSSLVGIIPCNGGCIPVYDSYTP